MYTFLVKVIHWYTASSKCYKMLLLMNVGYEHTIGFYR